MNLSLRHTAGKELAAVDAGKVTATKNPYCSGSTIIRCKSFVCAQFLHQEVQLTSGLQWTRSKALIIYKEKKQAS
jgi:hypothetical protein